MADPVIHFNEKELSKKLKRELEGWREIIFHLHSLLVWEKTWYSGVIVGVSTVLFMSLWMVEPSLLSTVSVVALLITLLDYLVPTLSASLCDPTHWTAAKEKSYEQICATIAHTYTVTVLQIRAFRELKVSSPKLYYAVTIVSLTLLAYIGNKINNLVLTYFLVTVLLSLPGLNKTGVLQEYYQLFLRSVANLLKSLHSSGTNNDKLKVK